MATRQHDNSRKSEGQVCLTLRHYLFLPSPSSPNDNFIISFVVVVVVVVVRRCTTLYFEWQKMVRTFLSWMTNSHVAHAVMHLTTKTIKDSRVNSNVSLVTRMGKENNRVLWSQLSQTDNSPSGDGVFLSKDHRRSLPSLHLRKTARKSFTTSAFQPPSRR